MHLHFSIFFFSKPVSYERCTSAEFTTACEALGPTFGTLRRKMLGRPGRQKEYAIFVKKDPEEIEDFGEYENYAVNYKKKKQLSIHGWVT